MLQNLYEKAKSNIKTDASMALYYAEEPQYLETDALGVRFGVSPLQVRDRLQFPRLKHLLMQHCDPKAFTRKSLTVYNSIKREAQGILHGLEKFHNYCFAY